MQALVAIVCVMAGLAFLALAAYLFAPLLGFVVIGVELVAAGVLLDLTAS